MRGPGEVNMDLGLSREFRLKERYSIQFRAEAFNFTNTPHFANPGGNVSNLVKSGDVVKRSRRFCPGAVGCEHRPRRHRRAPVPFHARASVSRFRGTRQTRCILPPTVRGGNRPVCGLCDGSAFLSCSLAIAWGQEPARTNPFDTFRGVAQGRALFQIHCSYCHGANGEGGRGADLTTGRYRRGGSDANLYATVRNGIPGTEMPAVRATDDEVWKMVAFVKRLGSAAPIEKAAGRSRRRES